MWPRCLRPKSSPERRKLYAGEGYNSLFTYCVEALGFSEDETCNRTGAVRAVLEYPLVLEMLEARSITMTTARLLYPHLKAHADPCAVLRSAAGKTRREVEHIIAVLSPKLDVPTSIRRVPTSTLIPPAVAGPRAEAHPVPISPPRSDAQAQVAALSADRFRLQVTISGSAVEKLQRAQDMLSHALPSRDAAVVLERALDLLLEELARRRYATTDKPRAAATEPADAGSRHIPAAVKRAVWTRDRGSCAYVGPSGHRCGTRRFLEFHHRHPFALGGPPTVENVALRCAQHNRYEAQVDFGRIARPGTGKRTDGLSFAASMDNNGLTGLPLLRQRITTD
jgi:hypothetical protein